MKERRLVLVAVVGLIVAGALWVVFSGSAGSDHDPSLQPLSERGIDDARGSVRRPDPVAPPHVKPPARVRRPRIEREGGTPRMALSVCVVWLESGDPAPSATVYLWRSRDRNIAPGDRKWSRATCDSRGRVPFDIGHWDVKLQAVFPDRGVTDVSELSAQRAWGEATRFGACGVGMKSLAGIGG